MVTKSPRHDPQHGFKRSLFLVLLQYFILANGLSGYPLNHSLHHSLITDKAALLAFKKAILEDPHSNLSNWDENGDVCNFTGVKCSKKHNRVVRLNLNDSSLVGTLSPFIANLTQLRVLELINNHFFGTIPPDFGSLRKLRHVKLDYNNLNGPIPDTFSLLSNLTVVTLKSNNLSGNIPPSFFSNCTLLHNVDFSENSLGGMIPEGVGNCPNLWNLNLYFNQLEGEIPASLPNASALANLDLENNNLSGELPSKIIAQLHELRFLHLSYNSMVSHDDNNNMEPFFTALANCSNLLELELAGMGLGGRLPSSIGGISPSLDSLLLQENHFIGSIPPEITRLLYMTVLNLNSNLLNGSIPDEISQLSFLEELSLSYNQFTGEIPSGIGHLTHLVFVDLSNNRLSGEIPESLGNLVRVNSLFLNNNLLSGKIPSTLGRCADLYKLDLAHNRLKGSIPPEISELAEIRIFLNLSHNELDGQLPIELSKLENVQEIDLSSNKLGGVIFVQISRCIALRKLNLSNNSLTGHLPDSLGDLWNLEVFDVSRNKLSEKIPISLSKLHSLTTLDLSFNNFEGMIPTGGIFDSATNLSFIGNEHLCGFIPGIPGCHRKRKYFHSLVFLVILCAIISVSAFIGTIACAIKIKCFRKAMVSSDQPKEVKKLQPDLLHNIPRITQKQLSAATGGFDPQRLIGSGSYGRVYKGVLSDGTQIAVKVLHLQTGNSTKSFSRECQVLRRIRHRNLIRIITACSLPDFKALVLPYMANGSLESRLYPHHATGLTSGSSDLSLVQRVSICSDIAEGMAYLHHHSPVKVVHCDLKPSNVLLNDDMTALVSDFGIARLIATVGAGNAGVFENMGNSTANLLCGSIGYIAPEYAFGSSTSIKGDVYSFGVLVLEMVVRKRPTDDMFTGGLNLHKYAKSNYHRQVEIVDSSLTRALKDQSPEVMKMWEVAICELLELGILCTQESPTMRPTMLDAADDLDRLRRYLSGDTTATFASSLGISSSTLSTD